MKYSETKQGRIFVIRLEDGDCLHEKIETFAKEKSINAASLIAVGGADAGSKLVVGPENGRSIPAVPMETVLNNVYEIAGTGTLFPDDEGNPILHMHIACGRKRDSITGCVRRGVKVWHVMEIILTELADCSSVRTMDDKTGFKLLNP
ncbi:DNA-binding protein [bacterium]|nr:DNA-binding protein [bacterium]